VSASKPHGAAPAGRLGGAAVLAVIAARLLARPRGAARAVVLGVAGDVVFGDPRRCHPVAAFGAIAARLERVTYRPSRRAGAVYAAVLAGGVAVAAAWLERLLPKTLARAVCLWAALGGRSLAREANAVGALVESGDLPAARLRIRSLVGRDAQQLDATGLSRAAIESVAENTVDAVIAPLVWTAVAGAPGVLAHRAINTLDAMVGNRSDRYARFGTASARADDVMNWPAARVAAALTVALSGEPRATLGAWRDGAGEHPSPNAGQIEAAFAGALGLTLGGTLAYHGRVEHRPRLGHGREPQPSDIARAVRLARRISLATALLTWRVA
jgi:adenosylcobinamide-phosphate synthase